MATARALERKHLVDLTRRLRSELETRHRIGNVICSSPAMRKVMQLVSRVAPTTSTVLITGETGTGKDVIARAIHYNSARRDGPFVVADCASLSESLLESELFGHVRGAFTGAVKERKGLAETARGGTLFLDEISTISASVQGSLLRLIQEREIRPVGSDKAVSVDVRLIAATNKELQSLVEAGEYREDLFYRLSVFTIRLPPLAGTDRGDPPPGPSLHPALLAGVRQGHRLHHAESHVRSRGARLAREREGVGACH